MRAFRFCAAALVLAGLLAGCGGGQEVKRQVWEFDDPSAFAFDAGLISVNDGGDSLAELKRLPDDAFWTATYEHPLPEQAPEYHQGAFDPAGNLVVVGSNTDMPQRPITGQLMVAKYGADGQLLPGWPQIYGQDGVRNCSPPDAWRGGVDGAGAIAAAFIAAAAPPVVLTLRYGQDGSLAGGFPRTVAREGYLVGTRSCLVDGEGNIYTLGFSYLAGNEDVGHTTFIVKYPPGAYAAAGPSLVTREGVAYTRLTGFAETLGEGSEGAVLYQLSPDGETWYYHDGERWSEAATSREANLASEVESHIGDFAAQAGSGTLHVRVFLVGDGNQAVRLDAVSVEYE
ncbi:MAG: hypothetical protein H5T74_07645 [Actinobacteria bacterium]|nr:hypothetical protein [Actinomycetota bacterium]